MTVARVPIADEALAAARRAPPSQRIAGRRAALSAVKPAFPLPRPSCASIQKCRPTKLKGMRASKWYPAAVCSQNA